MVVARPLGMKLHAVAELAGMLVEGRLEPDVAQPAPVEPCGRDPFHLADHRPRLHIGCAEQFERPRRPPPFGKRGAFRSEEQTSELQSLMRISYAVYCLIK